MTEVMTTESNGPSAGGEARRDDVLIDQLRDRLSQVEPERLHARREAERAARDLIESRMGRFEPDDIKRLYRLFNQDWANGGPRKSRFAPAFSTGIHLRDALRAVDALNRWVKRLWEAGHEEVPDLLDEFAAAREIPGAGTGLPTMVLYLKDPDSYNVFMPSTAKGAARLAGKSLKGKPGSVYPAFNSIVHDLRARVELPHELVDLALWWVSTVDVAEKVDKVTSETERVFEGFNPDAFEYFRELSENNNKGWYEANKARRKAQTREPMRRFVTDVGREFFAAFAPHLEREAKFPNTLSVPHKNIHGRKGIDPYWPHYWAAFHRADRKKTDDFQLIVSIHPDRLEIGMSTVSADPADDKRFRQRLREHQTKADELLESIRAAGLRRQRYEGKDEQPVLVDVPTVQELLAEPPGERLDTLKLYAPDDPVVASAELIDEAIGVYAALLPLYLLATHPEPMAAIAEFEEAWTGREGDEEAGDGDTYTLDQLVADTLLPEAAIESLVELLRTKGQLIFYGPPGTGKTWLAERFGRYLAGASGEVKTIQFHPSYSYEDFVEGIRPRSKDGQLSYEVVPGVFRRFCEEARRRPKARFVLVIDEINRGNLPRIFGELLYLLERRGQEVELPVSGAPFSIPPNVILVGTMNTADQSIALLDMALRRRFHFERFDPNPDLLSDWLGQKCPGMRVVADVLVRVNELLEEDGISADRWIGHSHFMDSELDEEGLERVWNHSVLPTIEEFFYGQPERLKGFAYEALVEPILGASAEGEGLDGGDPSS